MSKRSAAEAFDRKPLSAFAAAKAKKDNQPAPSTGVDPTNGDHSNDVDANLDSAQLTSELWQTESHEIEYGSDLEYVAEQTAAPSDPTEYVISETLSRFASQPIHLTEGYSLRLQKGDYVTCAGTYDLQVKGGVVTVYGALLAQGQQLRIFAPFTHALPTIVCRAPNTTILLKASYVPSDQNGQSSSGPDLSHLSPLWNRTWPIPTRYGFDIVYKSGSPVGTRPVTALELDDEAQKTLNRIGNPPKRSKRPSIMLVAGPKGSGKSTFNRHLLNTTITSPPTSRNPSCFWLDLDPGQPEFGPPGLLSLVQVRQPLLGPSFTHPLTRPSLAHRLVRSHCIGSVSPVENLPHFLLCVADLIRTYNGQSRTSFPDTPLLINTPGWISGSGEALLLRLLDLSNPNEIIVLDPGTAPIAGLVDNLSRIRPKSTVTVLTASPPAPISRPASELRAMQSMSYFHAIPTSDHQTCWLRRPLSTVQPLIASYSGSTPMIKAVLSYHDPIPPNLLARVLEGMPVGLVVVSSTKAFGDSRRSSTSNAGHPAVIERSTTPASDDNDSPPLSITSNPEAIPYTYLGPANPRAVTPLDPAHSHCLGQALIRHIDTATKTFHLITPVSEAEIHRALQSTDMSGGGEKPFLVLVRGRMDGPDWSFTEDLYYRDWKRRQGLAFSDEEGAGKGEEDFDISDSESDDGQGEEGDANLDMSGLSEEAVEVLRRNGRRRTRRAKTGDEDVPYVSFRAARPANDGGRGTAASEATRTGGILSERVWRPRHLPRNPR